MDETRIELNYGDLKVLEERYTAELMQKAVRNIDTYTRKIQRDAKKIIDKEGYRDTGRLINSIKPSVKAYADKITGEVNAGTKYARFIHEGAEHESDTKITRHFVPFKAAPSLFKWAVRNGVIYQKTKQGNKAKSVKASRGDTWYFTSSKTGKEYAVNAKKGGLPVMTKATKFFETPFEALKDEFITEMSRLVGGVQ